MPAVIWFDEWLDTWLKHSPIFILAGIKTMTTWIEKETSLADGWDWKVK